MPRIPGIPTVGFQLKVYSQRVLESKSFDLSHLMPSIHSLFRRIDDSFVCDMRHLYDDSLRDHSFMCAVKYEVATISRLLKIIDLFCKRAL